MKQKITILIVIFVVSNFLIIKSLGNDVSFIKESKEWHCTTEYSYDSNMEPNYSYKLIGDTILNNTTYKKVFHRQENLYHDNDWHYYAAVSEVDKKVYIVPQNEESATLLYDFDIEEGEVVNSFELHSKTDYWVRGYTRNYINVVAHANEGVDVPTRLWTWVEGIGCQEDPFNSENWHNGGSSILSCYENNTLIFGHQDFTNPQPKPEHEYIPYVQDGNEWVMLATIQGGYRQYRLGEVENIEGIDYHKIYTVFYSGFNSTFSEPSRWGYVREVDKKVYFGLEGNDRLVYDFGAQVGDTIRYDHLYDDYSYYTVVNSIENKYISGKERTVQNVTHHVWRSNWEDEIESVWIEGIGADEDIFESENCYRLSATGPPDQFNYYYNSLEQIRYPENGEVIDFSAVSTTPADAKGIVLHCEGDVLVAVFPAVGAGEVVMLYNASGRVVATQPLRQGATTATIDISHLPQGIYIAHMANGASRKVVL